MALLRNDLGEIVQKWKLLEPYVHPFHQSCGFSVQRHHFDIECMVRLVLRDMMRIAPSANQPLSKLTVEMAAPDGDIKYLLY